MRLAFVVYQYWALYYALFDATPERFAKHNVSLEEFLGTPSGGCFNRLNKAIQDYCILEIAKLHDPAGKGEKKNLSIHAIKKMEIWHEEDQENINRLISKLELFYQTHVREARNKILAHNNLSTYLDDKALGEFEQGEDEDYFRNLVEFCTIVWKKIPNKNGPQRSFTFTKSGLVNDPLCPVAEGEELGELIVNAFASIRLAQSEGL